MSNAPENNQECEDRDFERAVHRAMRSCGWLLPRTPEELRQAEAELTANPIELPQSLRDPFRVLGAADAEPSDEHSASCAVDEFEGLGISDGLRRLVTEVGLRLEQVTSLISMRAQIIANRSTSRNEELSYEDWKRFYEAVKEFL